MKPIFQEKIKTDRARKLVSNLRRNLLNYVLCIAFVALIVIMVGFEPYIGSKILIADIILFFVVARLIRTQFPTKREQQSLAELSLQPTMENLQLLMMASGLTGDDKSNLLAQAQIRMLKEMSVSDWRDCPAGVRTGLIRKMMIPIDFALLKNLNNLARPANVASPKNKIILDYRVAVIQAVAEMNHSTALNTIRRLANSTAKTPAAKLLQNAAAEVLPAMEERFATLQQEQTLLRPSSAPLDSSVLLRPAGHGDGDEKLLLRPSSEPNTNKPS